MSEDILGYGQLFALLLVCAVFEAVVAWKYRRRAEAQQCVALAVFLTGLLAGGVSYHGYTKRQEMGRRIGDWSIRLIFDGVTSAAGATAKDALQDAEHKYAKYTIQMFIGGGIVACALLYFVVFGAMLVSLGPSSDHKETGQKPGEEKGTS